MTANQINRWKAETERRRQEEDARHARVTEALTERDVSSNETFRDRSGRAALSQASAAHRQAGAAESQARTAAQRQIEEARHNVATESQAAAQLQWDQNKHEIDTAEKRSDRYLRAQELDATVAHYERQDTEAATHNRNVEAETATHNRNMEATAAEQAAAATSQAATAAGRLDDQRWRTLAQNVRDYSMSLNQWLTIFQNATGWSRDASLQYYYSLFD